MATSAQTMEQTVREFLKVAGGENDIATGLGILSDDILMHMDNRYTLQGHHRWCDFIRYLRRRRSLLGLGLACERIETEGDRATFYGRWYDSDGEFLDPPVIAVFRFEGDRIVELWSRRLNYVNLFGQQILKTAGFWVFALRAYFWCRFSRIEK